MMKVSVPAPNVLADLCNFVSLILSKKDVLEIIKDLKDRLETAIEKEKEVSQKETEYLSKINELKFLEEKIYSDKQAAEKELLKSKELFSKADERLNSLSVQGQELSKKSQEFEQYKKQKLLEISEAESKIAADLVKAHNIFKEGQILKNEYEEKLSKLKEFVR